MNGVKVFQSDIYHNTKEKQYPDGFRKISVASRKVYKERGWEASGADKEKPKVPKPQNRENASRSDSVRRAKQKVYDIAAMNSFDYFITWTINGEKLNRYSSEEVTKKVGIFLKNSVRRYGLKYLILPEKHKDGAIHIHGLVSGNMKFTDSGTFSAPSFSKPVRLRK